MSWVFWFFLYVLLAMINSTLVKYATRGLSWEQNLAYSRLPVTIFNIYMIAKYFRFEFTKYSIASIISGFAVAAALPMTYYIIGKLEISKYSPLQAFVTAAVVLGGFVFLRESFDLKKGIGIALAIGSMVLLIGGSK
jgi:uncharacterized membrane protein